MMISRRMVTATVCGLVSAPAIVRASSLMPLGPAWPCEREPGLVTFRLLGWNDGDPGMGTIVDPRIFGIHVARSWRAAWL